MAVCARSDVTKLGLKEASVSGWQEYHWLLFVTQGGDTFAGGTTDLSLSDKSRQRESSRRTG